MHVLNSAFIKLSYFNCGWNYHESCVLLSECDGCHPPSQAEHDTTNLVIRKVLRNKYMFWLYHRLEAARL